MRVLSTAPPGKANLLAHTPLRWMAGPVLLVCGPMAHSSLIDSGGLRAGFDWQLGISPAGAAGRLVAFLFAAAPNGHGGQESG